MRQVGFRIQVSRFAPVIDILVMVGLALFAELRYIAAHGALLFLGMARAMGDAVQSFSAAGSAAQVGALLLMLLHSLLFYLFNVLFFSMFLPVVYLAFRLARWDAKKANVTFTSEEDLYYFRKTFPDMSPATVSLLMDLEIEDKKDIAASLLQMYRKGWVVFSGKKIVWDGQQAEGMDDSDKRLLQEMTSPGQGDLVAWKTACMRRAVGQGYFLEVDPAKVKANLTRCKIALAVVVALAFAFIYLNPDMSTAALPMMKSFEEVALGRTQFSPFFQSPQFVYTVLKAMAVWVYVLDLMALIALPLFMYFYARHFKEKHATIQRTRMGERATAQLMGLKNFIHDFTLLGEATKEKVVLWNDFLVYALVLEENTELVKEIGRYYPTMQQPLMDLSE